AGGTSPYSYVWSPGGALTSTALNLSSGNYSVTVTDANGCTESTNLQVQQPLAIGLVMGSTPALCNGSATGSATVNASGGTGAYSYLWTPSNASSQSPVNLSSG